jgi:hypothetical protein
MPNNPEGRRLARKYCADVYRTLRVEEVGEETCRCLRNSRGGEEVGEETYRCLRNSTEVVKVCCCVSRENSRAEVP